MSQRQDCRYKTTVEDEHWRDEEYQWVRILTSGHAARGMVLLYLQKACTAFHEFEPACRAGAVKADHVEFFGRRLSQRLRQVITTMENNELDHINGVSELRQLLRETESANSLEDLANLSELVHSVSHMLLDSLES